MQALREQAAAAREAGRALAALGAAGREALLLRVAEALQAGWPRILEANAADVAAARAAVAEGRMSEALAARLPLTESKREALVQGIRTLAGAGDPVGRVLARTELAEGLVLERVSSPLGLLLVIFEARPDALPQIASLALASGNGLLLKGGREAAASNSALHEALVSALAPDVPAEAITLVHTREDVAELLALDDLVDLVIPRGSGELVRSIQARTRIPVLGHADGICHVYVDGAADLDRAVAVVVDSKCDYPAACNAMETLLLHRDLLDGRARVLVDALRERGVALYGDAEAASAFELPQAASLSHEYGDLAATVAVVGDLDEAIAHVHRHGSGHTDAIVTTDAAAAERFLARVDSACVFHDCSTRFADGYRFGLGAEVGISTSRIHARGPVGVEGLLTSRWLLRGRGDRAADFNEGARRFTHRPLDPTG